MVLKKTPRDWQPCGDYQALNRVTISDRYPIPHILDFTATLHGTTVILQTGFGTSLLSPLIEANSLNRLFGYS